MEKIVYLNEVRQLILLALWINAGGAFVNLCICFICFSRAK